MSVTKHPPVTDEPIYWFAILERALDRGDLDDAAHAKRELERLGVTVTYRRRPRREAASVK